MGMRKAINIVNINDMHRKIIDPAIDPKCD